MYTLADLVRITGAKRRSLQLWAEAGALKAEAGTDYQGSGVHRTFSKEEALIACVLNGFARQNVPIGNLRHVAHLIREDYLRDRTLRDTFDDAMIGRSFTFLIYDGEFSHLDIWSQTRLPGVSLQEAVIRVLGETGLSVVLVDLIACFRNAPFRLNNDKSTHQEAKLPRILASVEASRKL